MNDVDGVCVKQGSGNWWYVGTGFALGSLYLLIVFVGAELWPRTDKPLKLIAHSLKLEESALACGPSADSRNVVEENRFFIFGGNSPRFFEVEIFDPPVDDQTALYLGPIVDRIELLICGKDGEVISRQFLGSQFSESQLQHPFPRTVFRLTTAEASARLLLKVDQDASASVPIVAEPISNYLAGFSQRSQIQTLLYGMVSMMVIYNITLSFLLRNRVFLFNALISGSMLALDAAVSGFGLLYLWPQWPKVQDAFLVISMAGPVLFGPLFCWSFLSIGKAKELDNAVIYKPWGGLGVVCILSWVLGAPEWLATGALAIFWLTMALIILVDLFRRALWEANERAAVILAPLLGGVFPPMFLGITREYLGWEYGAFAVHHTQMALVLEAALFTLAVA